MTPEERAYKAMDEAFKDAQFDPTAYAQIERLMSQTIRDALDELQEVAVKSIRDAKIVEREACAMVAQEAGNRPYLVGSILGGDTIPIVMRYHIAESIRAKENA